MKLIQTAFLIFLSSSMQINDALAMHPQQQENPKLPNEIIGIIKEYRKGQAQHDSVITAICPSTEAVRKALLESQEDSVEDEQIEMMNDGNFKYMLHVESDDGMASLFENLYFQNIDMSTLKRTEANVGHDSKPHCVYENDDFFSTVTLVPLIDVESCEVFETADNNAAFKCYKKSIVTEAEKDVTALDLAANQQKKKELSKKVKEDLSK